MDAGLLKKRFTDGHIPEYQLRESAALLDCKVGLEGFRTLVRERIASRAHSSTVLDDAGLRDARQALPLPVRRQCKARGDDCGLSDNSA